MELENKIKCLEIDRANHQEKLQQASSDKHSELENLRRDKELFNMETEVYSNYLSECQT